MFIYTLYIYIFIYFHLDVYLSLISAFPSVYLSYVYIHLFIHLTFIYFITYSKNTIFVHERLIRTHWQTALPRHGGTRDARLRRRAAAFSPCDIRCSQTGVRKGARRLVFVKEPHFNQVSILFVCIYLYIYIYIYICIYIYIFTYLYIYI